MDATDNLKRVASATFVKSVTEDAVEAFCRDFEFVEGMVIAADNEARGVDVGEKAVEEGGEDEEGVEKGGLRRLFPRTTGEIRVLLS